MLFNLLLLLFLPIPKSFLGLLLVCHIAHEHLGLEGLDHVLALVHVEIGFLEGIAAQLILVVLLHSIHPSSFNLIKFK